MGADVQPVSRREQFARLNHDCFIMRVWNLTGDKMKYDELAKLSMAQLADLYNKHADKKVKRFESREVGTKRVLDALEMAGIKVEGMKSPHGIAGYTDKDGAGGPEHTASEPEPAKQPGRKGKGAKPAPAPAPVAEGKPAKAKGKAAAAPEPKAKESAARGRGAPKKDFNYTALKLKPGVRLNPTSARTLVYNKLDEAGKDGMTREALEKHFTKAKQDVNVKSALDYLVKMKMVKAGDIK